MKRYIKSNYDEFEYVKENDEPLEIKYDFKGNPYFSFHGFHFLDEFVRTHNNPWVGDVYPDFIDGADTTNPYHPLFIELVDGDAYVNVYTMR